ncbi:MAG: aspartate/glutamate racemase family protein [Fimbriimonadaceae bacterium]|nr:aspartate/glutamate racemase family protein [Fimbriimonadaceae bacterium]
MKWLGLIGGTTWHSTAIYYRHLNELASAKLGGVSSAKCILVSLDFQEVVQNQSGGDLSQNESLILDAAVRLKSAGAEGIMLCANTMHFFADKVTEKVSLPVIHIAEATADAIKAQNLSRVALLGTKYTMEMDFYRDKLSASGIEWLIPNAADRDFINKSIFEEMGLGVFSDATRARYVQIIESLKDQGAEGAILGCTEIPMLISAEDVSIPTFDTTLIHAMAASEFALSG